MAVYYSVVIFMSVVWTSALIQYNSVWLISTLTTLFPSLQIDAIKLLCLLWLSCSKMSFSLGQHFRPLCWICQSSGQKTFQICFQWKCFQIHLVNPLYGGLKSSYWLLCMKVQYIISWVVRPCGISIFIGNYLCLGWYIAQFSIYSRIRSIRSY